MTLFCKRPLEMRGWPTMLDDMHQYAQCLLPANNLRESRCELWHPEGPDFIKDRRVFDYGGYNWGMHWMTELKVRE